MTELASIEGSEQQSAVS